MPNALTHASIEFVGADGRPETLPAGTLVYVLDDDEIRDAVGVNGMRPAVPGIVAPEQGWADLLAWFGPRSRFGYPRFPSAGPDDYWRAWKGAREREPNARPFMWRGRFRYVDASQLTEVR